MFDTYKNLLDLKERTCSRGICIWGAKITGGAVCSVLLREGFTNIKYVVDSNPNVQGKTLYGISVSDPSVFLREMAESGDKPFVIVAAAIRGGEIFDLCRENGLKEDEDFCWADDILGPVYEIDLTDSCNLSCPSCPQSNYMKKEKAVMELSRFKRIVRHILEDTPNVAYIPLFCWSEPFLRKDLHEFAAFLKEEGILGIVSTNFSLEIPNLDLFIKTKPEYFRVSFSGFSQETYEKAHRGGNINLVKSNLYRLRYLLDQYSPNTFVEIYFHEYNYTPQEEIHAWEEVCQDLRFTFSSMAATVNPIENQIRTIKGESIEDIQPVLDTLRFQFDLEKFPDLRNCPEVCYSFKNMFYVDASGRVMGCDCLYDEERSCVAPDIETASYLEMIEEKRSNEMCQECLRLGLPMFSNALSSNPKLKKIAENK